MACSTASSAGMMGVPRLMAAPACGARLLRRRLHLARGGTVSALRAFSHVATAGNPEAQYQLARVRTRYLQASIS
jgi:hypothetical protein